MQGIISKTQNKSDKNAERLTSGFTKPSIPKGTRDFSPVEMERRNYIFDTIKDVFYRYGFKQIETPAMENLSTLLGKYGDEGDKLLFKILNSGDFMKNVAPVVETDNYLSLRRFL